MRSFFLGLVLCAVPGTVLGIDLSRFAYQAPVLAGEERLLRLPLDPAVLASSRPGLADVRLVSPAGEEIPYLLLGKRVDQAFLESRRVELEPLEVRREQSEVEGRVPRTRQTVELAAPPDVSTGWTLVVDPGVASTVRGVTLEGLLDGAVVWREETSLFRLDTGAERLRYALPETEVDRVRLILEGEEGWYLTPRFRYESQTVLEGATPVEITLGPSPSGLATEPPSGWSGVAFERPRGVAPDRLQLTTATEFFDRAVRVWDLGPGLEPREIGSGRILRVPSFTEVEQLSVAVAPARGDRLEIWIETGDSPPLRELACHAVVDRPALVFARPEAADGDRVGTLYFGGRAVERPRYDLASLAPPAGGPPGPLTGAVRGSVDPALAGKARLGAILPNPSFDASAALAFALRPGATADSGAFTHRFAIEVPAEGTGPVRIVVPVAALSVLEPDRRDLRIVDEGGRQWPYLWTGQSEIQWTDAALETRSSAGETEIRITPEPGPLASERLRFELREATFVDRPYRLVAVRPGNEESSPVEGRLRLEPAAARGVLELGLPPGRVTALRLWIVNGDERPLDVAAAALAVARPVLYLVAPPGSYSALVGAPDLEAPRYDLERERDLVLGLPSLPARVGDLEPNPDRGFLAGWSGLRLGRVGLWAALGLAVLGMGLLALRLVREE